MFDVSALKDDEHSEFAEYADAVAYADELADEWEEASGLQADRSWASQDNMYAIKCADDGCIQVVRGQ
jgi:hypothetical protein